MTRQLLITFAVLMPLLSAAQTPFSTRDSLDINNINSSILVHGDLFWDPLAQVAHCEMPKGSGKHANFASALWMSGYSGSELHLAAQTYREPGNDYWPGPLDASDTLVMSESTKWAQIWKVYRSDITWFLAQSTHTTSNTPAAILYWPGKGNINAQGNDGVSLTITTDMAPFVDLNSNGIYEPLQGEYPDVKGDEALWWVFNDNGPSHNNTNARPLKAEVHVMAYAYKRGTLIDNVQYFSYTVINRSANNYSNFRFALHDDADLGFYRDDFIGFDSTRRMGFAYNGEINDTFNMVSPGSSDYYGYNIPIMGITFVHLPGDDLSTYVPAGSFTYYNNDFSALGNPTSDVEYDNYMRSKWRTGQHFANDFAGSGINCSGYGPGPDVNYVFSGDPSDATQWSECNCNNVPQDRKFILTSSDVAFNAGARLEYEFALLVTPMDTSHACPDMSHFNDIKVLADTAWHVYQHPLPASVQQIQGVDDISIYPNPSQDVLHIDSKHDLSAIVVYNSMGQSQPIEISATADKYSFSVAALPPGVYFLKYEISGVTRSLSFIKD